MNNTAHFISLNGELIQEGEARISAVSSGLYYGAGCFETFLSDKGSIFKFQEHIERLKGGLKYLGIEDEEIIAESEILDQIKKLLEKNNQFEEMARIRVQVSLNEKSGYSHSDHHNITTIITSTTVKKNSKPQKLILSETSVVPSSARPTHFKLSNMLHYRHAFREAEKKNADDAVMLNIGGYVAETSIANIFWMNGDDTFTPSAECDILPGIMRNSFIDVLRDPKKMNVKEGKFSFDELMDADSVWLTNSAMDFIPVSQIEDTLFETETDFFSGLREQLQSYKNDFLTHV